MLVYQMVVLCTNLANEPQGPIRFIYPDQPVRPRPLPPLPVPPGIPAAFFSTKKIEISMGVMNHQKIGDVILNIYICNDL